MHCINNYFFQVRRRLGPPNFSAVCVFFPYKSKRFRVVVFIWFFRSKLLSNLAKVSRLTEFPIIEDTEVESGPACFTRKWNWNRKQIKLVVALVLNSKVIRFYCDWKHQNVSCHMRTFILPKIYLCSGVFSTIYLHMSQHVLKASCLISSQYLILQLVSLIGIGNGLTMLANQTFSHRFFLSLFSLCIWWFNKADLISSSL